MNQLINSLTFCLQDGSSVKILEAELRFWFPFMGTLLSANQPLVNSAAKHYYSNYMHYSGMHGSHDLAYIFTSCESTSCSSSSFLEQAILNLFDLP